MAILFSLAIGLGAALLFTVQPMVGKMLLPRLGGSPATWNTCLVFFQALLLGGYAYAHLLTSRVPGRRQGLVHAVVVAAAALALPVGLPTGDPPADGSAVTWALRALAGSVGLPFFVLASTGPLVQRWFAAARLGRDPYVLYAVSNAGSLGGLLLYPFVLEPAMRLDSQARLWSLAYLAFGALVVACGLLARRGGQEESHPDPDASPTLRGRARWTVLALVPSALLLGSTQYVTSELAAVPLLWVVPLATYLLTFVAAFSPRLRIRPVIPGTVFAVLAWAIAASLLGALRAHGWLLIPLHVAALAAAGLACHSRLYEERPGASRLTEYYLWIAVGGALGGACMSLAAPLLFKSTAEYPLALFVACLLRPRWSEDEGRPTALSRALTLALPAGIALLLFGLTYVEARPGSEGSWSVAAVQVGLPSLLCLALLGWRTRFALATGALLAAGWIESYAPRGALHRERTFFGVHRVSVSVGPPFAVTGEDGTPATRRVAWNVLIHGTTRHGTQAQDPELRRIPTTYYHPTGPIGQVFRERIAGRPGANVGLVGLGAGTLAAYGEPGQAFTAFEIDPAVVRIARDPGLFTYLQDTRAEISVVIGDGRRALARYTGPPFDLLVVDAFNSDAIPVHLMTREAFEVYLSRLAPDGILALHLTNQYMNLPPVVAAIGAEVGLVMRVRADGIESAREAYEGKDGSVWAVAARHEAELGPLAADPRWVVPAADPSFLWTDDRSSLLRVLRLF